MGEGLYNCSDNDRLQAFSDLSWLRKNVEVERVRCKGLYSFLKPSRPVYSLALNGAQLAFCYQL